MDDHHHDSRQTFNCELIKGRFTPSTTSHYHINFNFKFEIKISEFVVNHGSAILTSQIDHESVTDSACVTFVLDPDMPLRKIRQMYTKDTYESINTVLTSLPLSVSGDGRRQVIEFALREVNGAFTENLLYGYRVVDLDILVQIEDRSIWDPSPQEAWGFSYMVPAADSSVQLLLTKYNINSDSGNIQAGSCCCSICLQDLSYSGCERGALLLSMPCEHVFHGGCLKKWLRTSHYCPLCRFKMPTTTT